MSLSITLSDLKQGKTHTPLAEYGDIANAIKINMVNHGIAPEADIELFVMNSYIWVFIDNLSPDQERRAGNFILEKLKEWSYEFDHDFAGTEKPKARKVVNVFSDLGEDAGPITAGKFRHILELFREAVGAEFDSRFKVVEKSKVSVEVECKKPEEDVETIANFFRLNALKIGIARARVETPSLAEEKPAEYSI